MIKTIFWFIIFWLYQFFYIGLNLYYKNLGKKGKTKEQKEFLYKVTSRWAKDLVTLTGSKVEVIGLENVPEQNVLYVSNHQGNFDIPVLMGYLPKLKGFIAKVELSKMPLVNRWMDALGCVYLNRKDTRQSLKAIIDGIDKLKNGHTMVVFPEGTRSKGKKMGHFKKGSMKLAIKSNVPIVPVTINGTYKMLEEKKRIQKAEVSIIIHPPIYMNTLTKEEKNQLSETVYHIIQKSLL